jgi:hypothetical protein
MPRDEILVPASSTVRAADKTSPTFVRAVKELRYRELYERFRPTADNLAISGGPLGTAV